MNPLPETQPSPAVDPPNPRQANFDTPTNWREALMALIASRIALIQLEGRQAAKCATSRAIRMLVVAFCLLFAWVLLLAGGVTAISAYAGWPWHWVAISTAVVHLLLAWIIAISCTASPPAFPATRAEFQKDREWIENFQKKPKSSN